MTQRNKMQTYQKNGMLHGKFNFIRNQQYDAVGKTLVNCFFNQFGFEVQENDLDQSGKRIYENPDLKVTSPEKSFFIEAEIKSDKNWKYIYDGVDIPSRKYKYAVQTEGKGFFFMGKEDLSELLLIKMLDVRRAVDDCGSNYCGQTSNFGFVPSSPEFVMPEHGCHRVRKFCKDKYGITLEDFVRIPYKNILHYKLSENKKYIQIKNE